MHRQEVYAISSALNEAPAVTQQVHLAKLATKLAQDLAYHINTGTADPEGCTQASLLDNQYEQ